MHSFLPYEGAYPSGRLLIDPQGNLYGTAENGGGGNPGGGTVFVLKKSGELIRLLSFAKSGLGVCPLLV